MASGPAKPGKRGWEERRLSPPTGTCRGCRPRLLRPTDSLSRRDLPAGQNKFQDERVRQAVSMSFDRDLYISTFYNVDNFKKAGLPIDTAWNSGLNFEMFAFVPRPPIGLIGVGSIETPVFPFPLTALTSACTTRWPSVRGR